MRILVTGASGSGTSTLGRALAEMFSWPHFDCDDYYWLPTIPPFATKRDGAARLSLLLDALSKTAQAVVSGSVINWGSELEDSFSLIVFLTVPASVRIERLRKRELAHLGHADPVFLEWAAQYDEGKLGGRSLAKHRQWLSARSCQVLPIEGEVAITHFVGLVVAALPNPSLNADVPCVWAPPTHGAAG